LDFIKIENIHSSKEIMKIINSLAQYRMSVIADSGEGKKWEDHSLRPS
jgi:hypothetical protein